MWKKFSFRVLIFTSLIVLLVGGFNLIVDPYDIFDSPKIEGFNANKPEIESIQRVYKAIKQNSAKTDILLIGTSRTDRGLDPANKNIKQDAYNSSISSGLPREYEFYIDTAVKNGAKEVIIGVDLFTFYAKESHKPGFDETITENYLHTTKYILSIDALVSSFKTVKSTIPVQYYSNGFMNPNFLEQEANRNTGYKRMFYENEKGYFELYYAAYLNKSQTLHWQAFERILDKAHKRGIKITLFISPSHARQWEVLAIAQGWKMFEEYRRRLVAVNEDVARRNGKEAFVLWDFAGYHPLTTETVPDDPKARMKWYWDSSHYKKELGDIVLDRMFDGNFSGGRDYPDFGVKLTSQNIKSHLAKLRADRAKWRASHPVDVAEIEALKVKK